MSFLVTATTISKYELQIAARKIMHEFFADFPMLPLPNFKLIDTPQSGFLGRTTYNEGAPTTQIETEKSAMLDPKTLDRVLCHEMIHHVNFMTEDEAGHGQNFLNLAAKINAKRGPHYVTVKSDDSYQLFNAPRDFYLLIMKEGSNYTFQVEVKLSPAQLIFVQSKIKDKKAKVLQSKDEKWFHGAKIGENKMSIPNAAQKAVLKELFEGAPAALQHTLLTEHNAPAAHASFLVKAADRYPHPKMSKHKGDSIIIYEAGGVDVLDPFGHKAFDRLVKETEGPDAVAEESNDDEEKPFSKKKGPDAGLPYLMRDLKSNLMVTVRSK